ncbi:MAG: hypothetical protein IIA01_06175 [Proteobacteria bacterium]|nr:hypothetical protein [Pseudomonadota bacterium]
MARSIRAGAAPGARFHGGADTAGEIEIATGRVPCTLHLAPLYDPKSGRVKS